MVSATAHAIIARAETAANDDRKFWHLGAGDSHPHFCAMLGYAAFLIFLANHKSGDILKKDQGDFALTTQFNKVGAFLRRL